jgi:hypothetical protein
MFQKPQKGRGGVAICALNSQIWSAFKSSVADVEPCKKPAFTSQQYVKKIKLARG